SWRVAGSSLAAGEPNVCVGGAVPAVESPAGSPAGAAGGSVTGGAAGGSAAGSSAAPGAGAGAAPGSSLSALSASGVTAGGVLGTPAWSADASGASGSGVTSRASSLLFGGTVLTVSSTVGDGITVARQQPRTWWGAPVFRQELGAADRARTQQRRFRRSAVVTFTGVGYQACILR